jgi:hypothetical protein
MLAHIINKGLFKFSFGFLVALPITLIIIFFSSLNIGAIFYFFNIFSSGTNLDLGFALLGFANLLGICGLIGAWSRLVSRVESLSRKLRNTIKALLALGIAGSIILPTNPMGISSMVSDYKSVYFACVGIFSAERVAFYVSA